VLDNLFVAVGLGTFVGLIVAGIGAMVSRELSATGACAATSATLTFLTIGAGVGVFGAVALYLLGAGEGSERYLWAAGGFLAPLFWCYGGGLLLNQVLDRGAAMRYEGLAVVDKEADEGVESTSQVVVVQPPPERACEGTWRMGNVAARSFDQIVPGTTTLTVVVAPGFFRFPWVKAVAIETRNP
jgi:hypothetical protein